jgi:hypothetical protein
MIGGDGIGRLWFGLRTALGEKWCVISHTSARLFSAALRAGVKTVVRLQPLANRAHNRAILRVLVATSTMLASSARTEVVFRSNAGIYAEVIGIDRNLIATIALNESELADPEYLTVSLAPNDVDPLLLNVILVGRNIFCFPAAQPTNSQPFQLLDCYVEIESIQGFSEQANFVSVGYLISSLRK